MNRIKNLLFLSSSQRKLCKRLESGRNRLFRMAYAWSHDADIADEVVQETMIKAIDNIDRLRDIDALDGWLYRILSNCFYDHCRKKHDTIDIDDIVLIDRNTPESISDQDEMLAQVRNSVADLPVKYRQVVTLVDLESFSYAEVASILGVPIGTVMSRLNRARQNLRNLLEAQQLNRDSNNGHTKVELKVVR